MAISEEKGSSSLLSPSSSSSSSSWAFLIDNPVVGQISKTYSSLSERRNDLNLPNPGQFDLIAKEVERDVFLNNHSFTGLRADITKAFSGANPLFQVSHAFSMGSQTIPPYSFNALYGSPKVFLQASLDNEKSLSGRFNYRWSQALVSKIATQIAASSSDPSGIVIENEYTGNDFTASLKFNNPSLLEGSLTGSVAGEYLQAITPNLSLGLNLGWDRSSLSKGPDTVLTYAARYKTAEWIGTARFIPAFGIAQFTYWKKLADRIEAGVALDLALAGSNDPMAQLTGQTGPNGNATIGIKYDFRGGTAFRAQIDSKGRVSSMLDKRITPAVGCTFIGSIDHVKNEAKVGLSVSIESMTEEVMEQQQRFVESGSTEMASIPF